MIDGEFKDGDWFACEFPERMPVLNVTWFHHLCRPCLLAAMAMDPYWPRSRGSLLSEVLEDSTHPGRAKLDEGHHDVHVYEPPIVFSFP